MAHIRQPRLDFGIGLQVQVLQAFSGVPFSLWSGRGTVAVPTLHHRLHHPQNNRITLGLVV